MELSDSLHPPSVSRARPLTTADSTPLCDRSLTLVERYWGWLLAGILFVQLIGFNGQWRVERDSAFYLTTGRSLAEGHGYSYRDQPNHLIFPGLPYLIDAVFRLFHTQSTFPLLVLMLLIGWATLGVTYRLFYLHAGRSTAIVMTLGLGLTRLFYRYCFEILSDLPFLLGVMAFLAGYEALIHRPARDADNATHRRKWYDYALLIAGLALAISMRIVVWVLLAAVLVSVSVRIIRRRASRLELPVAVGVMVAVAAFYLLARVHGTHSGKLVDDYEGTFFVMLKHGGVHLDQLKESSRDLFPKGAMVKALFGCGVGAPLNTAIGGLVVLMGIGLFFRRVIWGSLVIFTVVMLLLFKPLDRYFLPVIPLLVFAWWQMLVWLNHRLPGKWGDLVFFGLFFAGLGTNIARIGEMVVEQRRLPFLAHYHEGRYDSLESVAQWLKQSTQNQDWILVGSTHGRVLTYKAHRNFFEPTELPATLAHEHLFMLIGPSWEETKDGRHKEARSLEESQKERDRMAEWLSVMSMQPGPVISAHPQGPLDRERWILYRLVAKK